MPAKKKAHFIPLIKKDLQPLHHSVIIEYITKLQFCGDVICYIRIYKYYLKITFRNIGDGI